MSFYTIYLASWFLAAIANGDWLVTLIRYSANDLNELPLLGCHLLTIILPGVIGLGIDFLMAAFWKAVLVDWEKVLVNIVIVIIIRIDN